MKMQKEVGVGGGSGVGMGGRGGVGSKVVGRG